MPDLNDWRRQGQEKYLKGVTLSWKEYSKNRGNWEHDHCEFCGAKFMESGNEVLKEGYTTQDNYRWICSQCFDDFVEEFEWKIEQNAV